MPNKYLEKYIKDIVTPRDYSESKYLVYPNLTDKKFPGNPTKSYRSQHPFKVIGEVKDWQGHSPEQLKMMRDHLAKLKEQDIEAIED